MMVEDKQPYMSIDSGLPVKKSRNKFRIDFFNPDNKNFLATVCEIVLLEPEIKSRKSSLAYASLASK